MTTLLQWRIYIGPVLLPATDAAFFDWSAYAADGINDLTGATTVATSLVSGATSLVCASAAALGSKGGVWVGPNGSGQAWEYIGYTGKSSNTLTGLQREPVTGREHNGIHTAGAVVRAWWPLTQNDGRLHWVRELDDTLTAATWYAEISGIAAPQAVFRQNHVAVVQYRTTVSGTWTNLLVGFLDAASIRDDNRQVRGWSARLVSIAGPLDKVQATGVRVGEFDAARHGSAQSSTPLPAAHKERWTGDFTAAEPTFEAANADDGDTATLWIADELVGTPNTPDTGYSGYTQLYLNPPASLNKGYRWVEIFNRNTASVVLVAYNSVTDAEWNLEIPSVDLTAPTSADDRYMIICENEALFLRENPSQRAARVYSVEQSNDPSWFDHLQLAGGALAFKYFSTYSSSVYYGTTTNSDTGWGTAGWTGASLAAPGPDETARYKHTDNGHANTKDDWSLGRAQSPGYTIKADGDDAWWFVELPGMGLQLRDDISASAPGASDILYVNDAAGPFTGGLPSSGTVQIGDERISYSAKSTAGLTVTARGASGTTAAAHAAGDPVLLVDGGVATDALPIRATRWERYTGTITPTLYTYRWAKLKARTPADSLHENDYDTYATVDQTASPVSEDEQTHSPALRVKSLLIEFKKMSTDPARPRLNVVKCLVDESYFDSATWLTGTQTVGDVVDQLLTNAGLPAAARIVSGTPAQVTDVVTAAAGCWSVAVDVCEFGGASLSVGRDSRITVAPDTLWTTAQGGYSAATTWTRSNAAAVEKVQRGGMTTGQVKLAWRSPDGTDKGTALYPADPAWLGAVVETDEYVYADQTTAETAAAKRYWLNRYPYELLVEAAAGDLTAAPRQIHRVQWQLADDMQPIDRYVLVRGVDHLVEHMVLTTAITGLQIDRVQEG